MPPVREADVAVQIREYLERVLGLRVFRADASLGRKGRRSGSTGMPDLFGVLPGGQWWAIEVKRPGARPRPNEAKQNETIAYLRANGARVIVARDVADVQRELSVADVHRSRELWDNACDFARREIARGGAG